MYFFKFLVRQAKTNQVVQVFWDPVRKFRHVGTRNLSGESGNTDWAISSSPIQPIFVSSETMAAVDVEFPLSALLPKKETGVTSFLSKYPEYDGRGITIAILDSGIDPGAPGLQVTSDGKRKLVEAYDCSGAGDVDISTVVQAKDGEIQGLTGRKLKVPDHWNNPSGNFHIGVKNGYELYTSEVRDRCDKHHREKNWDPFHKVAVAKVNRKIQEFEKEHPQKSNLRGSDKLEREDLDAQLEVLLEVDKKYNGFGPTYDCIVYHDGEVWRACIDTSETGDLASCKVLGEYSKTYDYAQLTACDQLNYAINVWDEGKVLEIVGMSSTHGTHVAAIASACFPDEPEKNGVAPGAQIISLGIGDTRLTSMETGTALTRAMIRIMQNDKRKVQVMNMSYGETAHHSSGRVLNLMSELIDKYGPVWVVSAGNNGPALSTVTTPVDNSAGSMIGVGAYVSPEMMAAEYSMRKKLPGTSFTWTSRGPTANGDFGVSVCAPGAAITSVAQYSLRNSQLMNGTSMASPHVSGVVALLLSGMVQQGLPFTPYSVKRALQNTATFQDSQDEFGQGQGLVQVEKAFEHLTTYCNQPDRNVRFNLTCGSDSMRGIYLRDRFRDRPEEIAVSVEPIFHNSTNVETNKDKTDFMMQLSLVCDKAWISHPSHLALVNGSRIISVHIDPTGLPPGVHTANIRAYDVTCVEKGPVFRIPITVVQPQVFPSDQSKKELVFNNVSFKPNSVHRHFVLVPEDATYAVFRMLSSEKGHMKVHALQLRPHKSSRTHEFAKLISVTPSVESVHGFAVRGGLVMELVVAKFWKDLSEPSVNYSLSFFGIKPDRDRVVMQSTEGVFRMDVRCGLQAEVVAPHVCLNEVVSVRSPTESKIIPLSPTRDLVPPGRQIYELQLTYTFHVNRSGEVSPICPLLSDQLYECEYESQLWMLFNKNKQYIASGDAYPEKYSPKLDKGDYTVRMHIRHERQDLLEKLTEKPLLIRQKLPSKLHLDVYDSEGAALTGSRKVEKCTVPYNQTLPIYIAPIPKDKISKTAELGQYLNGKISLPKDELGKEACSYQFQYIFTEPPKKSSHSASKNATSNDSGAKDSSSGSTGGSAATNSKSEDSNMKYTDFLDALLEFKTDSLAKLEIGAQADALYEELKGSHQFNLSVHTAMLNNLKSVLAKHQFPIIHEKFIGEYNRPEDAAVLDKIVTVADTVINQVDQNALLAYYGMKTDMQQDAAKVKTAMDRQKNALVEALCLKGIVLCRRYVCASVTEQNDKKDSKEKSADLTEIDAIWKVLLKFVKQEATLIQPYAAWYAAVHGHHGRLLKILFSIQAEEPKREMEKAVPYLLRSLGWEHWAKHFERSTHVRYPHSYRLF